MPPKGKKKAKKEKVVKEKVVDLEESDHESLAEVADDVLQEELDEEFTVPAPPSNPSSQAGGGKSSQPPLPSQSSSQSSSDQSQPVTPVPKRKRKQKTVPYQFSEQQEQELAELFRDNKVLYNKRHDDWRKKQHKIDLITSKGETYEPVCTCKYKIL